MSGLARQCGVLEGGHNLVGQQKSVLKTINVREVSIFFQTISRSLFRKSQR